jgi:hypothetical protein
MAIMARKLSQPAFRMSVNDPPIFKRFYSFHKKQNKLIALWNDRLPWGQNVRNIFLPISSSLSLCMHFFWRTKGARQAQAILTALDEGIVENRDFTPRECINFLKEKLREIDEHDVCPSGIKMPTPNGETAMRIMLVLCKLTEILSARNPEGSLDGAASAVARAANLGEERRGLLGKGERGRGGIELADLFVGEGAGEVAGPSSIALVLRSRPSCPSSIAAGIFGRRSPPVPLGGDVAGPAYARHGGLAADHSEYVRIYDRSSPPPPV